MVLPTARLFFTTWALLSTTAPTETTATATARTTCSAFVGTRTRTRSSKSFATINVNPKSVYSSHASNSSTGATKLTASNSRKISTLRQHESSLVVANYNHDLDDECPPGYYLDSVNTRCNKLGPLGRASQIVERVGPLEQVSRGISNLFGIDRKAISSLGVTFALSYSLLSNINGSISLSVAWYMFCQRVSLTLYVLCNNYCLFFSIRLWCDCFPSRKQWFLSTHTLLRTRILLLLLLPDGPFSTSSRTMEVASKSVRNSIRHPPVTSTLPSSKRHCHVKVIWWIFRTDTGQTWLFETFCYFLPIWSRMGGMDGFCIIWNCTS